MTAINMSDVLRSLEIAFEAGLPVKLDGAPGIGKTESALAYAERQGPDYGLFELNCAVSSLPDVIGMPTMEKERFTVADGETTEIISARYAYPYFMRDKRTDLPAFLFKRGLIVLEEYGQAQADVKRALAPVMWEKRVGQHKFPDGCDVLILSNRPEDRSGVTKDFDFLINRRVELQLRAELDGWIVWAHTHNVSNMSMAYAARNEGKVFSNKAPEKQGPWLTPRSLVSADKWLAKAAKRGLGLDDDLVRINLGGLISDGTAHEYIAFAKLRDKLPSIDAIIADPTGVAVPREADRMMFLAFDLASKTKRENFKPIAIYMDRLPSDFSIAFYRSAVQRDTALRSTKEFGDWAVKNQQLLAAVSAG